MRDDLRVNGNGSCGVFSGGTSVGDGGRAGVVVFVPARVGRVRTVSGER